MSLADTDAVTVPGGRRELAPSETRDDAPILTQLAGMVGLGFFVAGGVSVVAATQGYRAVFEGSYGYLALVAGLTLMFVHAIRDGETEVRRLYGAFALTLLVAAGVVSVVPPRGGHSGDLLLPWGAVLGFLSLAFWVPFSRNEAAPGFRRVIEGILLWAGVSLCVSTVVAGVLVPDFLVGPGVVLGLLGLGFVGLYLANVDPSVGTGRAVAVGLGALGLATIAVAVGRSVIPAVFYDGPGAIRAADQSIDAWKASLRGLSVLTALGVAALAFIRTVPNWLRTALAVLGVSLALALVVGSFSKPLVAAPAPFLIPYGVILLGLGLVYGGVSLAVASESHFVVIARRELTAYFYSPTGYLILLGAASAAWASYAFFAIGVLAPAGGRPVTIPEPITEQYLSFGLLGAIVALFLVPVLTMGLFAEERRTGTYEVLFTAPVAEGTAVLAKFFSAWLVFLLAFVPAGLYLVAFRLGTGAAFDYRPALTFYLALAACGAAFVSIGLFFSSLTKSQIVAAVLTFAVMVGLLLTVVARQPEVLPGGLRAVLGQFDFLSLWVNASAGRLPVQALAVQVSVAIFFLFLTTRVLEARKWA